jgi:hypothetical protein
MDHIGIFLEWLMQPVGNLSEFGRGHGCSSTGALLPQARSVKAGASFLEDQRF